MKRIYVPLNGCRIRYFKLPQMPGYLLVNALAVGAQMRVLDGLSIHKINCLLRDYSAQIATSETRNDNQVMRLQASRSRVQMVLDITHQEPHARL